MIKHKDSMKERSKSKATLDKADHALQNWFRWRFPGAKCEVCGARAQVRHHHIGKSKSNAGRFNHNNLIAMCHRCHSKIIFGDNTVVARYAVRRGVAWVRRMEKLKQERKEHYSKKELEEIIKRYSQNRSACV